MDAVARYDTIWAPIKPHGARLISNWPGMKFLITVDRCPQPFHFEKKLETELGGGGVQHGAGLLCTGLFTILLIPGLRIGV